LIAPWLSTTSTRESKTDLPWTGGWQTTGRCTSTCSTTTNGLLKNHDNIWNGYPGGPIRERTKASISGDGTAWRVLEALWLPFFSRLPLFLEAQDLCQTQEALHRSPVESQEQPPVFHTFTTPQQVERFLSRIESRQDPKRERALP
jgi:hypothetical protein